MEKKFGMISGWTDVQPKMFDTAEEAFAAKRAEDSEDDAWRRNYEARVFGPHPIEGWGVELEFGGAGKDCVWLSN